jgi:SAM-dependent methyltransferase
MMATAGTWESEAEHWLQWARTPGHDVFQYFWPAFAADILPARPGRLLEIGCGEGRVLREAMEIDGSGPSAVIGLEPAPTLVRSARDADQRPSYVAGDATALPFRQATFDTVVAYNSLQTMCEVDDMAAAVREAARVVRAGGSFCVCVAHPMTDIGLVASPDGAGLRSYFERQRVEETVTQDGLPMTFRGWTYTLEDYVRAFDAAGFVVDRVREPRPSEEDVAARPSLAKWRQIPLFLMMRGVLPNA